MELGNYTTIYFLGIGGIGMSALARYFNQHDCHVSGYDKTPTLLTQALSAEGLTISYTDQGSTIATQLSTKEETLIVYTPAIPQNHQEFNFFKDAGYTLVKRAALLGAITRTQKTLAVAGTHGKTTTSCLLAHLLQESDLKCSAFLGGISTNYNSNLIVTPSSEWVVVEADEFDRSFHQLSPYASIITSTDADHLDIYETKAELEHAFQHYAQQIDKDGLAILQHTLSIDTPCKKVSYGVNETDKTIAYRAHNLRYENDTFLFDLTTPQGNWERVSFGISGIHNVENAVSVIALGLHLGIDEETIRKALASFKGVKRRFEYHINTPDVVYIDDYAHHPTAINQLVASIRLRHKNLPIVAIFQPHLYSRTADFMDEFAASLSHVDELILLPIYPAREVPIKGITSEALLSHVNLEHKTIADPVTLLQTLTKRRNCVIVTIGAGDIDQLVNPIKEVLL